MSILSTLFIGFAAGLVAKLIMPGRHPGGFIITVVLGIVGALIGSSVAGTMGWYGKGTSGGLIYSFIGAILLLAIYRLFLCRILSWLTGKPGKKQAINAAPEVTE